ncbi:RES domain-containing protein [Clostridium pasteurianum]|uniref:RES domain-containing protein n=1 Tax=Clostridium pasteurianum TaxID=1501 RepID=UPI00039F50DF|nr:RES domain-containing protein [Clostridium pasteurianum]
MNNSNIKELWEDFTNIIEYKDKCFQVNSKYVDTINITLDKLINFSRTSISLFPKSYLEGYRAVSEIWDDEKRFRITSLDETLKLIKDGRFNKDKVSYFYVANKEDIAIKEIKVGDKKPISVAKFKSKDGVKIRISNLSILKKEIDRKALKWTKSITNEEYFLLQILLDEISKPVAKNTPEEYLTTQYIFDYIKRKNDAADKENFIDGFKYHSALGDGSNYVFFYDDKFTCLDIEHINKQYATPNMMHITDK